MIEANLCLLPYCFADCGTPDIPNGNLSAESTTVFNGAAIVICDEGYEGGDAVTCLSDATWGWLPPCTPVGEFEAPDPMPSGKIYILVEVFKWTMLQHQM